MTKAKLRLIMGNNIRGARTAKNMTLEELASIIGISIGFMGLIERGKRSVTAYNIYLLSEAFKVPVENFFAGIPYRQKTLADESGRNRDKKVAPLLRGLTNSELDFIIQTIQNVKQMNHERYL